MQPAGRHAFHSELAPETAVFHDYFIYDLEMEWSEERFREALDMVSAFHPMLRTTFHWTGFSVPLQVVHRQAEIPLTTVDLTGLNARGQRDTIERWIEREKHTPFDLYKAPLFRTCVHLLGTNRVSLALKFITRSWTGGAWLRW